MHRGAKLTYWRTVGYRAIASKHTKNPVRSQHCYLYLIEPHVPLNTIQNLNGGIHHNNFYEGYQIGSSSKVRVVKL